MRSVVSKRAYFYTPCIFNHGNLMLFRRMLAVKKSLGDFELNVNNVSRILQELDFRTFFIPFPFNLQNID